MQTNDDTAARPVLVSLRHRLCLSGVHRPSLAEVSFFSAMHCAGSAEVCYSRACTAQALPRCATFGRALPRLCRSVLLLVRAQPWSKGRRSSLCIANLESHYGQSMILKDTTGRGSMYNNTFAMNNTSVTK